MTISKRLIDAAAASSQSRRAEITQSLSGTQRSDDVLEVVMAGVHEELIKSLGAELYAGTLNRDRLEADIFTTVQQFLDKSQIPLSQFERVRLAQDVLDNILRHGPIEPLLRDPTVSEIMVTAFDTIYIERRGRIEQAPQQFSSEAELRRTIDRIVARVGRRIDESSPMVDARLPDGSRVNAVIPPLALNGAALTIRKFPQERLEIDDLIRLGTLSHEVADVIRQAILTRKNILVSGGTGSGKTTTLNVLSSFIPQTDRIITIEDAAELQLKQPHVIRLESRPPNVEGHGEVTIRDLVRNALRMRPDRIIVGEVRDGAALDMLQAMNTGHDGSLTTIHSNSALDALSRLETMTLMAGVELPLVVIREQIARAIDVVVHQERIHDGTRKVTEVIEVNGISGGELQVVPIYGSDRSRVAGV